jgi:hypothetical protein
VAKSVDDWRDLLRRYILYVQVREGADLWTETALSPGMSVLSCGGSPVMRRVGKFMATLTSNGTFDDNCFAS